MLNRSDHILIISDFPSLPSLHHLPTIATNPCTHLIEEERGKERKGYTWIIHHSRSQETMGTFLKDSFT